MSFFSGMVDPDDHVRLGGYPAPFRELLGLRVEDFLPLSAGQELSVAFADGTRGTGDLWSELVTPDGAEGILAGYDNWQHLWDQHAKRVVLELSKASQPTIYRRFVKYADGYPDATGRCTDGSNHGHGLHGVDRDQGCRSECANVDGEAEIRVGVLEGIGGLMDCGNRGTAD